MSIDDLIPLLPIIQDLWSMWVAQGKDPEAELKVMLDTADASVDAAEKEKFGP